MDRNIHIANDIIKLADNDMIRCRGRHTVVDGMLAFDWTNSGWAFAFNGTGFIISLGQYGADLPAYVKITVDGKQKQRFAVVNGSEKLIIEGLPNKRHRVEVLKITEGDAKLLFDTVQLLGADAALRNPPFNSPRRIEFIGDSITCGYGVLGRSCDPTYETFQQDGTCTYAALTAEKLGADARYHSNSGKGIVCNCNGDFSDVKAGDYCSWQTRVGGECNDGWIADVVVINIGTNDGYLPAPEEQFVEAAKAIIAKNRARYPDAHIIWVYGMMGNYFAEVLRRTIREVAKTDPRVHFLFVESMLENEAETGANGHPNMRASIRVSGILTKKIRALTGWKYSVITDVE